MICQGVRIVTGKGIPFEDMYDLHLPKTDLFVRKPGKTILGAYSFIGVNSVILKDVHVGEGAIVSAGSVVRTNVSPWTIVAGNPAKEYGKRKVLSKHMRDGTGLL